MTSGHLVATDGDLLACRREIERNPVRARLVRTPEDDPRSSDRRHAPGAADPVIAPHPLSPDPPDAEEARRSRYRGRFVDALSQDSRQPSAPRPTVASSRAVAFNLDPAVDRFVLHARV
jgi:hypothetical protein